MDRDLLPHLRVVLAVARHRSFVAAAAELGMGASAVSHAVRIAEDRLGAPLFARTTRSVGMTETGATLLAALEPAFADIAEAVERVQAARGQATGLLRINAPRAALATVVTPILVTLARRHPNLTVEVASDDGLTDIVARGFDAGIRLGEMIARDMVAVRLTPPFQAILVASPDYIAAKGAPATVQDLRHHNCVGFRLLSAGSIYAWELLDDGQDVAVEVRGTALVTDPTYAGDLALAGVGIAYVFEPMVRAAMLAGRLTQVLPAASITEPGLFVYFPRRSARMPKLRAFLDAARETAH